jgi:spore coat protein CotH
MVALGLVAVMGFWNGCNPTKPKPQNAGPDPFDEAVVATYDIAIDPADWNAIVMTPMPGQSGDQYKRATMTWRGETYPNVGVKASGQNSRIPGNPKPSLHLDFEEFVQGRKFRGLPSLKLNCQIDDPSFMRERLTYGLERAFGLAAPREVHCRVVVNGEYKGLYAAEERVTKSFVKARFSSDANQIYKFAGIDGDVYDVGNSPARYVTRSNSSIPPSSMFEATVDSLDPDAASVMNLILALNYDYAAAAASFDVETFLRELAVETVSGEEDAYLAGPDENGAVWSNNFYFYRNPHTGKFMLIPWDRNEGWWRLPSDASITQAFEKHVLTRTLVLGRPENLDRFKVLLRELVVGPGAVPVLQAEFDRIYDQIKDVLLEEPFAVRVAGKRPVDYPQWQGEAQGLRDYIRQRNEGVRKQLP